MALSKLWVENYRPKTLDEYIFQNAAHQRQIKTFIDEGEFPHLLFAGPAGTGKTSLAKLLVELVGIDDADLLKEDASVNNSVEFIRGTIESFVTSYPMGKFKVVWLEEADRLSPVAQDNLKTMMEDYSDSCRFIFTCNNLNLIKPPIRSRFQEFILKAPQKDEVLVRIGSILASEGIAFDLEVLEKFVDASYPDVRKIISNLELACKKANVLKAAGLEQTTGDYHFKMLDLLEAGDFKTLRKVVCENVQREEFESVYRFLYENLHRVTKFKKQELQDEAIVLIANYLYKNSMVADPEINFAACAIELGMLK
jgi:replication factor C small subunit